MVLSGFHSLLFLPAFVDGFERPISLPLFFFPLTVKKILTSKLFSHNSTESPHLEYGHIFSLLITVLSGFTSLVVLLRRQFQGSGKWRYYRKDYIKTSLRDWNHQALPGPNQAPETHSVSQLWCHIGNQVQNIALHSITWLCPFLLFPHGLGLISGVYHFSTGESH